MQPVAGLLPEGMIATGVAVEQHPAGHMAEAGAAHNPLSREAIKAQISLQPLLELPFGLGTGGKFAMGGLGGNGLQATGPGNAVGHPQTRAGTHHQQRCVGLGLAWPHRGLLARLKMG